MSLLPANVGTGHVTGVFVNSDGQAETGKVWLRPRFTSAKITTADPPTTVLPTPRSVPIGEDGRMAETEVVATSDPDLGLEAWTYEVTFKFDSGVSYGPFDIDVPEGETVDLTLVAPAAAANGVQTIRGFGVPDPADAADGDVVSYDATAGVTTWWSRSDAIGQALGDEFDDPDSPLHGSIDAAVGRVTDEALESRLSRTERTRHAPALGLFFPEAEGGDINAAVAAAAPTGGTVDLIDTYTLTSTLTVADGVALRGGTITTQTAGRMLSLGSNAVLDGVTIDAPGSVLGTMGAVEATGAGAEIRGCRFTCTDRDAWQLAIQPTATDTVIENTVFERGAVGIFVNPGVHGLTVRGCTFTDWTNRCISLNATTAGFSKIRIQDNEFGPLSPDTTAAAPRVALYIRSSQEHYRTSDIEISGNRVYGNGLGHSDTSMGPADMLSLHRLDGARIINNYLEDPGEVGIHVGQGSRKVVLAGNTVLRADTTGIVIGEVTNTYRIKDVTATNNIVLDSQWDRIGDLPATVTGGISFWHADGVVATGNRSGNTTGNTTQGYGVKVVDCTDVTLGVNNASGARLGDTYIEASTNVHGLGPVTVLKSEDTTRANTATNTADPHLKTPAAANTTYKVKAFLIYESSTTADISFAWNRPGGAEFEWSAMGLEHAATSSRGQVEFARNIAGTSRNIGGTGAGAIVILEGILRTVAAGDLALSWSQRVAEQTNTILRSKSYLELTRVG